MWSKCGHIQDDGINRIIQASAIITCKGRLVFLKETLPIIMSMFQEYILVDWSCPEKSGEWAKQYEVKTHIEEAQSGFNLSAARNKGASLAKCDWLFFLDVDITLTSDVRRHINLAQKEIFYAFDKNHCQGTIFCRRSDFDSIGGFNELLKGYGFDDCDFRDRLKKTGTKEIILPANVINHIEHGNNLRLEFYEDKDLWRSVWANRGIAIRTAWKAR